MTTSGSLTQAADVAASIGRRALPWERWTLTVASLGLLAVSAALYVRALPSIDVSRMTDLGLISVLPEQTYAALVLLSVSAMLQLRRAPLSRALLSVHLVALIVMLN